MKRVLVIFALMLSATTPAFCKTILPDACGDEKIEFDVSTKNAKDPPAAPETGKALIIFIQTMDRSGGLFLGGETTRFGMDGAWIGANHGDSYFTLQVSPSEHHFCVNWQGSKKVGLGSFIPEAGKTYYYEAKIIEKKHSYSGGSGTYYSSTDKDFNLTLLSDDEGKYRVKASKVSKTSPKQP